MAKSSTTMEGMFSSDPFDEQYSLLDEIARSVTYGIGTMERGGGPCSGSDNVPSPPPSIGVMSPRLTTIIHVNDT